jgi:hypothetical protein
MLPAVAENSGDCSAEETLAGKGKAVAGTTPGALKMGRHAPTVAAHGKGTGGVLFLAGLGVGATGAKGGLSCLRAAHPPDSEQDEGCGCGGGVAWLTVSEGPAGGPSWTCEGHRGGGGG